MNNLVKYISLPRNSANDINDDEDENDYYRKVTFVQHALKLVHWAAKLQFHRLNGIRCNIYF